MADIRRREDVAAKYKWDLTHIYANDDAWEAAMAATFEEVKAFAGWEGKVAEDPRKAIREYFDLDEKMSPCSPMPSCARRPTMRTLWPRPSRPS